MNRFKYDNYMVFDVESLGLYGEPISVAYTVIDNKNNLLESDYLTLNPKVINELMADLDEETKEFLSKNVIPNLSVDKLCDEPAALSYWFLVEWCIKKREYDSIALVVDCGFPVETNFLSKCNSFSNNQFWGPYPLIDLSGSLLSCGIDPTELFDREENEKPEHNPLTDALQTGRILVETLSYLESTINNVEKYTKYFMELESVLGKNYGKYPENVSSIVKDLIKICRNSNKSN